MVGGSAFTLKPVVRDGNYMKGRNDTRNKYIGYLAPFNNLRMQALKIVLYVLVLRMGESKGFW